MKPTLSLSALFATAAATAAASDAPANDTRPVNFGMVLFTGFQALDVFGPLDIFNILSFTQRINLHIIAPTLEPVHTYPPWNPGVGSRWSESVNPTHTLADPPKDLDVLFVPGGAGTRDANIAEVTQIIDYVRDVYPSLQHILSICTGAGILARAGVLDGRNATTNKRAWAQTTALGPATNWIAKARWVVDGNVYTSSGVSAGIDAALAYVSDIWGEDEAVRLAIGAEYNRVLDPADDPFAAHWGAEDVPPVREACKKH
ncbi:Isonitrile hydratase like protein [Verticillium longisporum]|uniref:Isonitrile hydratase like protein n=1 Tax=Verticillium longisporum TaxID=100787 RepID=A0A8I2ZWE4_VERLO|nr:Isonitrile hydratase like protein [Verticillium longisporum]